MELFQEEHLSTLSEGNCKMLALTEQPQGPQQGLQGQNGKEERGRRGEQTGTE